MSRDITVTLHCDHIGSGLGACDAETTYGVQDEPEHVTTAGWHVLVTQNGGEQEEYDYCRKHWVEGLGLDPNDEVEYE